MAEEKDAALDKKEAKRLAVEKADKAEEKALSLSLQEYGEDLNLKHLLESGAIPSTIDTPEKLMTIMRTGRELGMGPMTTLNNINVIKGRTVVSSSGLGALLKKRIGSNGQPSPVEFVWTKDFETVEVAGKVQQVTEIEFEYLSAVTGQPKTAKFSITWKEMVLAGYTEKDNWKRMPKPMMRARCMAGGVRAYFPEILLGGLYTDLEIADVKIAGQDEEYHTTTNAEGDVEIVHKAVVV